MLYIFSKSGFEEEVLSKKSSTLNLITLDEMFEK